MPSALRPARGHPSGRSEDSAASRKDLEEMAAELKAQSRAVSLEMAAKFEAQGAAKRSAARRSTAIVSWPTYEIVSCVCAGTSAAAENAAIASLRGQRT